MRKGQKYGVRKQCATLKLKAEMNNETIEAIRFTKNIVSCISEHGCFEHNVMDEF